MSSFVTCFATRSDSTNYEYTTSKSSQGLYMRHLLQHLGSRNKSVGAVFEMVNESFTREVQQSIASQMTPVYT